MNRVQIWNLLVTKNYVISGRPLNNLVKKILWFGACHLLYNFYNRYIVRDSNHILYYINWFELDKVITLYTDESNY